MSSIHFNTHLNVYQYPIHTRHGVKLQMRTSLFCKITYSGSKQKNTRS